MQGKIIKGIAGFYYVHTISDQVYACKAKGIFRKEKKKPLVGDNVEIDILDETEGNVIQILPRKNVLIRPAVANIDQAMIIFAAASPQPNFNLLDRFLITMEYQQVDVLICFNKLELVETSVLQELKETYQACGYQILFTSAANLDGIQTLIEVLKGKTTAVAGPSGVGKSSLINLLQNTIEMETGAISAKIARGKHTTRHSQLIPIGRDTFVMDTPGFSSLQTKDFDEADLKQCFREFAEYEKDCRFLGCSHINEPICGVKQALLDGRISNIRYENYISIYNEIKNIRRY
jgi:ribosome biogenesis GTPase